MKLFITVVLCSVMISSIHAACNGAPNGVCDTNFGENCNTCVADCPCGAGGVCVNNGICQNNCGNGICEAALGENCTSCVTDCGCTFPMNCVSGRCQGCGDGVCSSGESCGTCPSDCPCSGFQICSGSSSSATCVSSCGNGKCDNGEGCGSCAQDCTCSSPAVCSNNVCFISCAPNCGQNISSCVSNTTNAVDNPPSLSVQKCINTVPNDQKALVSIVVSVVLSFEVVTDNGKLDTVNNLDDDDSNNVLVQPPDTTNPSDIANSIATCISVPAEDVWIGSFIGSVATVTFVSNANTPAQTMLNNFVAKENLAPGCGGVIEGIVNDTFSGVFTDNTDALGLTTSCCVRGQTLYCIYSQLGILVGTLTQNYQRATGNFYQGGLSPLYLVPCMRGSFDITLSADGNSFTGFYTCVENPAVQYIYNETRVTSATYAPSPTACGALTTSSSATLTGDWLYSTKKRDQEGNIQADLIICSYSDSTYELSYHYNDIDSSVDGYESGSTFVNGTIGSGYFVQCDNRGTSLLLLIEDGSLVNLWWSVAPNETPQKNEIYYPQLHGYDVLEPSSKGHNGDPKKCSTNEEVVFNQDCPARVPTPPPPPASPLTLSSSSSTVTSSFSSTGNSNSPPPSSPSSSSYTVSPPTVPVISISHFSESAIYHSTVAGGTILTFSALLIIMNLFLFAM